MAEPVLSQSEHSQTIDFLRGLILLGLLVMNSQTYSLFGFLGNPQVYGLGLDLPEAYAPTQFFIHLLVKGQVVTLSSLLFGWCFYLFWQKSTRAGLQFNRLVNR